MTARQAAAALVALGACGPRPVRPPATPAPAPISRPAVEWDSHKRVLTCHGTETTLVLGSEWAVRLLSAEEARAEAGPTRAILVRAGLDTAAMQDVLRDMAELHRSIAGGVPDSVAGSLSADDGTVRVRYAPAGRPGEEYHLTYHVAHNNAWACRITGIEPASGAGLVARTVAGAVDARLPDFLADPDDPAPK